MRKITLISLVAVIFGMASLNISLADIVDEEDFDKTAYDSLDGKLKKDKTDDKEYGDSYQHPVFDDKPIKYDCTEFARDAQYALWEKGAGISTSIVRVKYKKTKDGKTTESNHAFLKTTLRGKDGKDKTVFIEPQNDDIHTTAANLMQNLDYRYTVKKEDIKIESVTPPVQLIMYQGKGFYGEDRILHTTKKFNIKVQTHIGRTTTLNEKVQEIKVTVTHKDGTESKQTVNTDDKGAVDIEIKPNKSDTKSTAGTIKIKVELTGGEKGSEDSKEIIVMPDLSYVPPEGDSETAYAKLDLDFADPETYAYVPRIAVQTHEVCVGTTYYLPPAYEEPISNCAYVDPDEPLIVANGEPVAVSVPEEDGGVPLCPTGAPPILTQTPPEDPPTTTTEGPPPEKEEPPDIGLAKAAAEIVRLVLTGLTTGKHVEGATVKSLDAPPALQLAGEVDPALTSSDAYASSVEAGFSSEDGEVTIGQGDTATSTDEQAKSQLASMSLVEVKVEEEKKGRVVIAMDAVDTAADASNGEHKLPASLAQPGLDLCVAHSFQIGKHPAFIASLPKSQMDEFQRTARQTEGIYFAEPDPCRTIYKRGSTEALQSADRAE